MDDHPETTAVPLFITGDTATATALRRLATAAGVEARLATDPETARPDWPGANAVVIGPDAARTCADARLPHRGNVILLTGPELPYDQAWPLALSMGATQVAGLPEATTWLARQLAPAAASHRAPVITITGARGGVGASTLATALALTAAAAGHDTVLVDADPRGGGLDVLLGWEKRPGSRWADLAESAGPFDPERLHHGLPRRDRLALLSFGRDRTRELEPGTAASAIDALTRGHHLAIVDAPRYGEPWLTELTSGSALLGLVVPTEVRAAAAARHVIAGLARQCERARLLVTHPSPGKLSTEDVVKAVGVPLAAELHLHPHLARSTEAGELAGNLELGGLAETARALLAEAVRPDRQPIGARS